MDDFEKSFRSTQRKMEVIAIFNTLVWFSFLGFIVWILYKVAMKFL